MVRISYIYSLGRERRDDEIEQCKKKNHQHFPNVMKDKSTDPKHSINPLTGKSQRNVHRGTS